MTSKHRSSSSGRAHHRPNRRPCRSWGIAKRQRDPQWSSTTHQLGRRAARPFPSSCFIEDQARPMMPWQARRQPRLVEADVDRPSSAAIYSSTRQAIKAPGSRPGRQSSTCIPSSTRARKCDPLIFCTGPVPAQQIEPFFPWLMERDPGQDLLPAPRPTTSGPTP